MTKVPELRFDAFDGEWEEKKVSDIGKITAGGDINKSIIKDKGKYPVIANGDNNNGIVGYYDFDYKIEGPAVTISARGNIGTAVARNYNFTPVVRLLTLKTDHNIYFTAENLNRLKIFNESTGVAQLTSPQLSLYKISVPTILEQEKIGGLFIKIDQLIESQQALVDQTKAFKKSMLQKMFPKKDSLVPEFRFDGFIKDWDNSKLGKLVNVTSVKRVMQSDWKNNGVPFLRARDIVAFKEGKEIEDKLYISHDLYEEYSKISGKVNKGDILLTGVGSIGIPFLIDNDNPVYFKDGNIIWLVNDRKFNGYYLYYYFYTPNVRNYIKRTSGRGTVETLTIINTKNMKINYPEIEEQEKIGNFFKNLDEKIASEEKLLEAYKDMKKSLLQKMFV